MTKHCQITVAAAQEWDTPSPLHRYCIFELKFWRDNLRLVNARDVFYCNPSFISVYSDASDIACHILGKDIFPHRMFTNEERRPSNLFWMHCPLLSSSRVEWFTDNQGAARIVQVGSMHFNLHLLAFNIFSFHSQHGMNLEIDWIPRSLNEKADYIRLENYSRNCPATG